METANAGVTRRAFQGSPSAGRNAVANRRRGTAAVTEAGRSCRRPGSGEEPAAVTEAGRSYPPPWIRFVSAGVLPSSRT